MGKIVVSENVTLDGVIQDPSGDEGFSRGGWVGKVTDRPEAGKVLLDETLAAEAELYGRRTYEFLDPEWSTATVLRGDVVDEVSKLKRNVNGEIVVPASIQLVRTLMEHNLVDELRLMVYPVVLGAGERLFAATSDMKPMRLVDSRTLDDSLAYLTYELGRKA
jgi:riboflavin biosynthesis pyrimidine reductase